MEWIDRNDLQLIIVLPVGVEIFLVRKDSLLGSLIASGDGSSRAVDAGIADNERNLAIATVTNDDGAALVSLSGAGNAGIDAVSVLEGASGAEELTHGDINLAAIAVLGVLAVNGLHLDINWGAEGDKPRLLSSGGSVEGIGADIAIRAFQSDASF